MRYIDMLYMFIIAGFLMLLSMTNQELKRNYEKGYNDRQAEITNYIDELEVNCKNRDIDERHYYIVISEQILNEKRTSDNYLPGISYHCKYIDYLESTPELKN